MHEKCPFLKSLSLGTLDAGALLTSILLSLACPLSDSFEAINGKQAINTKQRV
jgi:hypothetical protein